MPNPDDKPESPPFEPALPIWHTYRAGGKDKAGRDIDKVYAFDDNYIIYFSDCELFYETEHGINLYRGNLDAALARINRLLPDIPKIKNSPQYRNQLSTLELAADACEMVFCGETTEAMEILDGIRDKLQTTEEGKRRLTYQLGAVLITVLVVAFYALNVYSDPTGHGKPWILAACLAMAGGVFSVCLNPTFDTGRGF